MLGVLVRVDTRVRVRWHAWRAMVKATKQSVIAEQGVALISRRVSEMNHLWHPTSGVDSGIDGEIELRDPATGMVRNFRIGVQSKATAGSWRRETDEGFVWRVDSKHIDYWLDSNQPVLLVCSRPRTGEASWRNVQEWARDPETRASGLVEFDKRRDVFDASAAARFFSLEAREVVTLGPPGPERHPERLKSNLLPVLWDTDVLWSVNSPDSSAGAIFQTALAAGAARTDVVLQANRLWSLTPFGEAYLEAIGASDQATEHPLSGIAQSEKTDQRLLLTWPPCLFPALRRGPGAEAEVGARKRTDRCAATPVEQARRPFWLPPRCRRVDSSDTWRRLVCSGLPDVSLHIRWPKGLELPR